MAKKEELVVGLDIGTTKICAIVGEVKESGVDIVGIGTYPSNGLRKGVVVNIENTVESIKYAVEEAELMAGCEISSVYAGIAGGHIKGLNSHGVVAIREKEVRNDDLTRVIDSAQAVDIPLKAWHRVRVGPFNNLRDLNAARSLLKKNGVDAILIRLKN